LLAGIAARLVQSHCLQVTVVIATQLLSADREYENSSLEAPEKLCKAGEVANENIEGD
jgi:hypothetical protein